MLNIEPVAPAHDSPEAIAELIARASNVGANAAPWAGETDAEVTARHVGSISELSDVLFRTLQVIHTQAEEIARLKAAKASFEDCCWECGETDVHSFRCSARRIETA